MYMCDKANAFQQDFGSFEFPTQRVFQVPVFERHLTVGLGR